jgi:hypothetical protein
MVDTSYTIRTKSSGEVRFSYNAGEPNNWTRGETASFAFELIGDDTLTADLTVQDGETIEYGSLTIQSGVTLTIESGGTVEATRIINNGTIVNNGTLINDFGTIESFNTFADYAGSYATQTMLNSTVKYRNQLPDDEPIDSLIWGIEPSQDLQDKNVIGVWGIVDAIQNNRNQALTTKRYQVDVTVLAPYSDYGSISDVEDDLVI